MSPRRQPGKAQLEIVRRQPFVGEHERAAQRPAHEPWIDQRIAAGDPFDRSIERQDPAAAVIRHGATLDETAEHRAAEVGLADRHLDRRGEAAERTVEGRADDRVAEAQARAEQLGI